MGKYELTEETIQINENKTLYRIKALRDFSDVKAGDLGGFVESESNLSHEGNCWIYNEAKVFGSAKIYDSAQAYCSAEVFGSAKIYDSAQISDFAEVFGDAKVFDIAKEVFNKLFLLYINGHIEKKNGLSYLSWAWAWVEVKKLYPTANYTIEPYERETLDNKKVK